ncbi:MAG: hypothetical protein HY721_09745, partial [Planctomycetes bacterium]|nr:hypothetical protein [Planctomycetota bacterium]
FLPCLAAAAAAHAAASWTARSSTFEASAAVRWSGPAPASRPARPSGPGDLPPLPPGRTLAALAAGALQARGDGSGSDPRALEALVSGATRIRLAAEPGEAVITAASEVSGRAARLAGAVAGAALAWLEDAAQGRIAERIVEVRARVQRLQRDREVAAQALLGLAAGHPAPALRARAARLDEEARRSESALRRLESLRPDALAHDALGAPRLDEEREIRAPSRVAGLLAFAAAAAALAGAFALAQERCDTRFRGPRDLVRSLRLRVLGSVPPVPTGGTPRRPGLWTQAEAESFLTLASRVNALGRALEIRSLAITSCGAQEGKTNVAASLAVALAGRGRKVILVDGCLDRPALERLFGLRQREGLAELLAALEAGPGTPGEAAQAFAEERLLEAAAPTPIANLRVLGAGGAHEGRGGTAPLVEKRFLQPLLLRLARASDLVICDTPPVSGEPSALAIAAAADACLLVIRARSTERCEVEWARSRLLESQASVLGLVLNQGDPEEVDGPEPAPATEETHDRSHERTVCIP